MGVSDLRDADALDRFTRGGKREESIAFELVDLYGAHSGWLNPTRSGLTITNDPTRTIPRTVEGLYLPWDQAGDVDTIRDRVRLFWKRQDGSLAPLGLVTFAHAPRQVHSRGSDLVCNLVDPSIGLDQVSGGIVGYDPGTSVSDCLRAEWDTSGVPVWRVDASGTVLGGAGVQWPPGSTRRTRMHDLSVLAGFLDPYFDNTGVGVSRAAPDLSLLDPSLVYGTREGEYPILRGTITEDDDRLDAPNRWLVISTSGSAAPVIGVYDLPAWVPWSAANRPDGQIVCAPPIRVQGIVDTAHANAMAFAAATSDTSLNETVNYSSPVVPLHDTWDAVGYGDRVWLERSWRIGDGVHAHVARRSLVA